MRNRKKGYFGKIAGIIIIGLAIFAWSKYSWYEHAVNTPVEEGNTENVSFMVKEGTDLPDIAVNLQEEKLIHDAEAFKLYTRLSGSDRNLVAGRFLLSKSLTMPEVVKILSDSAQSELILTVPEGYTITQIDQKLVDLGLTDPGQFAAAVNNFSDYQSYPFLNKEDIQDLSHQLEGYLFPDTYFLPAQNFNSTDLIQLMLENFERKLAEVQLPQNRTLHELVTMASIVEKEVRTTKDIPIVAGILWKRLDNNWMIGADATLLYLKDDRTIDYNDLQEESAYNTRKNTGLPPGPISNPGLKSLQGAAQPEESAYFFYLTTPQAGEVIYAVSNEEHNENKAKYLY